jgi:endogenous inhibitor of DNA gyrase (YacG/DUF329 family)
MASVDVIVFKGIRYRRYPDAKTWAERSYYVPGVADRQKGRKRLHEEIWSDANGPVPHNHHIHHADHDPLNNDLGNLVCVTSDDHHSHHSATLTPERREQMRAQIERIRPLASKWHRSEAGRAWHSEHGKRTWEGRAYVERRCEQCQARFLTRSSRGHERFCSNACKSAWRRDSGLDTVEIACPHCGKTFEKNKYAKIRFCSRSCSATWNHAQKRET